MTDILLLFAGGAVGTLGTGFVAGLLHARDPDHIAAVSTIVSERKSLWSSAFIGGVWGLGHTISLMIAGIAVLLLDFEISETTSQWLEFGVGIMLILLGLNVFRKIVFGERPHSHVHHHGDVEHKHTHVHEDGDDESLHRPSRFSPRALIVGMIHGLAGSGSLMLALIPSIETKSAGLIYVLVFGVGSIGGMIIMSFLVGLPFYYTAKRLATYRLAFQILAGLASIAVGAFVAYENLTGA